MTTNLGLSRLAIALTVSDDPEKKKKFEALTLLVKVRAGTVCPDCGNTEVYGNGSAVACVPCNMQYNPVDYGLDDDWKIAFGGYEPEELEVTQNVDS